MSTPAIIMIVLFTVGMTVSAIKHGEPSPNYNFWGNLISSIISIGLLYWGGFFK